MADGVLLLEDAKQKGVYRPIKVVDLGDGTFALATAQGEALPAGTALIGIVSIDQVTAHANEVVAKPQIVIPVNGTVTATGPTTLVAAPAAGYRLALTHLRYQNESAVATTIQVHYGATATNGERLWAQAQGDGVERQWDEGREWRLPEATALAMTCSGANQCGWSAEYFTEVV
jgi:hypothetical protein